MRAVPILIAGGGPVGMTLALVLARLGVRAMLVERNVQTTQHPKMDITNARSMELFRGLGLVEALRAVAVAQENPFDVTWVTTMAGHELHRFRYPSVIEQRALIARRNDGSQPLEPAMRASQVEIEPVLKRAVLAQPLIEARFGIEVATFVQDETGVTVQLREPSAQRTVSVRCAFLVGCDGGGSVVRQRAGIELEGRARIIQRYMVHFRSASRAPLQPWGIAWHHQSPLGTLIAQDDIAHWTLQAWLAADEDLAAIDPRRLVARFMGCEIDCAVLQANPWMPHLLVAADYCRGRVLLAGDAAHQYIPTGGYGMNTGIGDAFDLGWKLAAVVHGFGGPGLLGLLRCGASTGGHAKSRHGRPACGGQGGGSGRYRMAGDDLDARTSAGHERRTALGRRIAAIGNAENECLGIELGYAYPCSPIVCGETDAEVVDDPLRYVPTTAPGARLPSVLLADGSALFDRLGAWFTLIAVDAEPDADLLAAATRFGVPLEVVRLGEPGRGRIYQAAQLLVRPDHHIAWRGRSAGAQAGEILARVLGWGQSTSRMSPTARANG